MTRLVVVLAIVACSGCAGALAGATFNPFDNGSVGPQVRASETLTDQELQRGCSITLWLPAERILEVKCVHPPMPAGMPDSSPLPVTRFCVVHPGEVYWNWKRDRHDLLVSCEVRRAP